MAQTFKNILLISGTGRNVGKTTFACQLISRLKEKVITVKISPHFHEPTKGLIKISEGKGWIIYEETNRESLKDSSLYLQAGAIKSFYIQAEKKQLFEVFSELINYIPEKLPVIIESTGLSEIITPGLSVKIIGGNQNENKNPFTKSDLTVISDGKTFSPGAELIIFEKGWKIKK